MRKRVILAIFFFLLSGSSFLGFRIYQTRQLEFSALQVTATPKSQVYLDGQLLGSTSLREELKPGEHTVKIVPEQNEASLTFEQKIKFVPFLLTAIDRTFRETDAQSEGSILTLEPISDKNSANLLIISSPPEAKVSLDNELKGVTPLELKNITLSDHEVTLNAPGFIEKRVRVSTGKTAGYQLTANVKLALSLEGDNVASPTPTLTSQAQPTPVPLTVKIKQTPTGFLRVRFSPSLSATEVARVKPGETFPILEEATNSGWTKISLSDGTSGWVSNLYITKLNP